MNRIKIQQITEKHLGQSLLLKGWVKTLRSQKEFSFLELNDGSTLGGIQIILDSTIPQKDNLATGAALTVEGILVKSPEGHKQQWELQARQVKVLGSCDPDTYPLQKKRHSFEFLRTQAHLRPRTNTQGAIIRMRNALAFATHLFFQKRGFLYIHTPIITASDCEGAGEQFLVTTLDMQKVPKTPTQEVDFSKDFFGKPAYLTVSGQLNAEAIACALSDVYTFGPTFRAENSNTSRHLAEFWMIEPEMAFADLEDDQECAESYLRFVVQYVLENCIEDLEFFENFIEKGLITRLRQVAEHSFARLTYTQAITLLEQSGKTFTFPHTWGSDLQSEHERYLAEEYCKKPVILSHYPADIKAFYMRANEDGKTVAAMDILVPKIGELVGGSQREERLDLLEKKIQKCGLPLENYHWYLDLRRYGSVPHAGFGAGFERLIQFVTGMENIRDVIPFPRYPGHAEF